MQKEFRTHDVYLASFLVFFGCVPLFEKNNGKVYFVFSGDKKTYDALDAFNRDIPTPISSFVNCSKALRGKMIALRNEG